MIIRCINERLTNYCYLAYKIKSEEYIKNKTDGKIGRVDITINSTDRHNRFAIILENKWESGDSCVDQVFKYYTNYTEQQGKGYTDKNLIVIYLTRLGNNPTNTENKRFKMFLSENKGVNYFPISYDYTVKNWLKKCVQACKSEKVKYTIEQYLKFI